MCAVVALAGLALLAGCGESEKEKYESKMKSISRQLSREQREARTSPNTLAGAGAQLTRLRAVITRGADRFEDVKPPSNVKDLHQRFIRILRNFAATVTPAIQAAESGNLNRFRSIYTGSLAGALTKFQREIDDLARAYKTKGYDLK